MNKEQLDILKTTLAPLIAKDCANLIEQLIEKRIDLCFEEMGKHLDGEQQ